MTKIIFLTFFGFSGFHATYTTLFGAYAAFLFAKTGKCGIKEKTRQLSTIRFLTQATTIFRNSYFLKRFFFFNKTKEPHDPGCHEK